MNATLCSSVDSTTSVEQHFILNMEAAYSSEMLAPICRTSWCYITEGNILYWYSSLQPHVDMETKCPSIICRI